MKLASRATLLAVFVSVSLFEGALPAAKILENDKEDTEGTTKQLLNFPQRRVLLRQGESVTQVPEKYEVIEIGTMLVNTPNGPKERSTCIMAKSGTFPFETVTPTGQRRKRAEGREADNSNEVNQIQLQIVPFNLVQNNNRGSVAAMPPRAQYIQRDRPLKQKFLPFYFPPPPPPTPPTSSYSSPPTSWFTSPLSPPALSPIIATGPPGSIVFAGTGGGATNCIIVGRAVGLEDLSTPTLIKSNLRRRNRRKRY